MPKLVEPGNIDLTHFAPEGWEGRCPRCNALVVTGPRDYKVGDETEYLIGCPTQRCEGRIPVSPPHALNGAKSFGPRGSAA